MTEQELRAMIRESVARQMGGRIDSGRGAADGLGLASASFVRLPLARGDDDGMCLIEPAVRCNQCGYCQSYGH